jgi:hypothetical protein
MNLNSNGYRANRLSARGTRLKTLIITIIYDTGSLPYFQ